MCLRVCVCVCVCVCFVLCIEWHDIVLRNLISFPRILSLSHSFYYSLKEFNLDDHDIDANTTGLMNDCSSKTHTQPVNDFGHSLFAGYVHTYIHVLHTVHI